MKFILPYALRRISPRFRTDHAPGFTLLEILASLLLVGLLSAIFGMGLVAAMQSHEFSRANVRLAQKAQPAMARMARELMELSAIEQPTVSGPTSTVLYHRMPQDDSASVQRFGLFFDSSANVIRLTTDFQDAPPLDGSDGDILVDGVSNLEFKFKSGTGTDDWNANDIRMLSSIEIVLDLFRPDDPSSVKQFRTMVHMRNTNNFGGATPTTRPASQDAYNCFISIIGTERE